VNIMEMQKGKLVIKQTTTLPRRRSGSDCRG